MFNGNRVYKIDKNGNKKPIFGIIPGLNIRFKGKNSKVILCEPIPKFSRCKIKVKDKSEVYIGSSEGFIKRLEIIMDSEQKCHIGNEFFTFGCEIIFAEGKNLSVTIGDNCMFAKNILIRPTDGHAIYDKFSKELHNPSKDIVIGNNVWIAGNSAVMKGVHIEDYCILGHGTVMTIKSTTPNSIYAGNPARLIKQNIEWVKETPEMYLSKLNF